MSRRARPNPAAIKVSLRRRPLLRAAAPGFRMALVLDKRRQVEAVVKRLWGFNKVRYRGLAKNATCAFTALALANIFMSRKRLMA